MIQERRGNQGSTLKLLEYLQERITSVRSFTFITGLMFIWALLAGLVCSLLPLWETRGILYSICQDLRGLNFSELFLFRDSSGHSSRPRIVRSCWDPASGRSDHAELGHRALARVIEDQIMPIDPSDSSALRPWNARYVRYKRMMGRAVGVSYRLIRRFSL